MNEENQTTQKSIYKAPRWRSLSGDEIIALDAHRGGMHMASEYCDRKKQEADQRLVKKKNKKKKGPPSGFIFDR